MREVLFLDPPAFCTTLEVLADPTLRRRPVAVSPPAADRAVLLAVSAEARAAGVFRGMAAALARRLCPDLVIVPPNPRRYAEAHRALHAILARVAPVIEPKGWGHAYLDLTGTTRLFGPPVDVARRLEREVEERLSFRVAVGVASNKLVSETAAAVVKRDVGAEIRSVAAGMEAAFLAPEPVAFLPEVPGAVRQRLDDYHLDLIGEVAALGAQPLATVFGMAGRRLHAHAQGIDPRPVLPPEVKAECRTGHTLATDTNDLGALRTILRHLVERLGRRLRTRSLAAGRLILTVRHADDTTAERAVALSAAALDVDLWRGACHALDLALVRRVAVRALLITADQLQDGIHQLELWPDPVALSRPKEAALQRAADETWGVCEGRAESGEPRAGNGLSERRAALQMAGAA